jgi:hypothetical protein
MATNKAGTPYFGAPPNEYNAMYFADLVRAFAQFVAVVQNPGELRGTNLVLTDLQSGDQGLEPGALYLDGNVLKVAAADIVSPSIGALGISDGDVTVSTA